MSYHRGFRLILLGIALLLSAALFRYVVAEHTLKGFSQSDLDFELPVFSVDNFYNANLGGYAGEQRSNTVYSFSANIVAPGVAAVKNIFDVRTFSGEQIVTIESLYAVGLETGKHVPGYGARDREGYLFGPRFKGIFAQIPDKSSFTYWHTNYDQPAVMNFVAEETIEGIKTYRYYSDYADVVVDQTDVLGHLEGVPELKGVILEPKLDLWIEPYTGQLVKYEDSTTAYFYDIDSGEYIEPWNRFRNSVTGEGIKLRVQEVQEKLTAYFFQTAIIPIILLILGLDLILKGLRTHYAHKRK